MPASARWELDTPESEAAVQQVASWRGPAQGFVGSQRDAASH